MKHLCVYLIAALVVLSCGNRPKDVLSENKMSGVLYEMYLADAANATMGYTTNIDSAKRQSYRYILHKYDVTVAQFDSSMVWYAANPDKQEKLYDRIIAQLQDLQKGVNAGKYKQIVPVLTQNDTLDVWQMIRRFDLINTSYRNNVSFHFDNRQFKKGNALLLTYLLKVNKDDKSEGNKFKVKIAYAGKTDSIVSYARKDGNWRRYKIFVPLSPKNELMSIDGSILDCTKADKQQSAVIADIHCYRIAYAKASKNSQTQKSWWQKMFQK